MVRRLKLVRVLQGSGWPSGHVAVDRYFDWPEKPGGNEMCLTQDATSFDELSREIDELIKELEKIRADAPARFEAWDAEYKMKRKVGRSPD